MPIQGFDYKAFTQNMLQQLVNILSNTDPSNPAVPKEVTNEDKKFIIEVAKKLCILSGQALDDKPGSLNKDQACWIIQFIAEWIYHKSIDMITGKVPVNHRARILQVVALNVFQTAKIAIEKKMPDENVIRLVEEKVKLVYAEEIQKLLKAGEMSEEQTKKAISASNLDAMAEKSAEIAQQEQAAQAAQAEQSGQAQYQQQQSLADKKALKLVALAIVLKNLPEQKANEILNSLDKNLVPHVINYMKTSNIEEKIDQKLMIRTLEEIKNVIPIPEEITTRKVVQNLRKLIKNTPPQILSNIAVTEREAVKDFILDTSYPAMEMFSPHVIKSLARSIEEKINDN